MKKNLVLILSTFTLYACEDVIEVDVPQTEPEIVIQGWVTDSLPAEVSLSTTTAYFTEGQAPVIKNAQVQLFENGNLVSVMQEVDTVPGLYRSHFTGTIGNTYHIEVSVPGDYPARVQGQWRSFPELMKRVPKIDSLSILYLDRTTTPSVFTEGDYVVAYFQEPVGAGDYFRVSRFLGDSLFTRSRFIVEDRGIDGRYFGSFIPPLLLFGPYGINDSHIFTVRFESVTEDYADFIRLISEQIQVGSPFDAPPALVIGNIARQNDSSYYGFGFFKASALNSDTIIYRP